MRERKYAFISILKNESGVINKADDSELAIVLKKKQQNRPHVLEMIDRAIEEKRPVFLAKRREKQICLIGHSQLDQWAIAEIGGYFVRNCGISGISSFEYEEKILSTGLLRCEDDVFLVMHGTNDIVWDDSIEEIVINIKLTIDYIRNCNADAPILFLACMHVNGRLDRSNARIDAMNTVLKRVLSDTVIWIDTDFMDDQNGNLDSCYTNDGLHLSEIGYQVLRNQIENVLKEYGL